MISKKNQGTLSVLAGAFLWGTTGTSQALLPLNSSPLSVGAARLASAALFLVLFLAVRKKRFLPELFKRKETYIASFSIVLYQLFFFSGVKLAGIALGTVLMLGSSTVFAGILAAFLINEKPEKRWYPASLLSFAGCTVLAAGGGSAFNIAGAVFAVCAGFSYSLFSVIVKKLIKDFDPFIITATVFLTGAVFTLPMFFLYPPYWVLTAGGLTVAVYLGLFATAAAYLLYTGGLKHINASSAVTLALAEPAVASLLGIFFIGEQISLSSAAGVIIIFTGLLYLSLPGKSPERKTDKQ